MPGSPTRRSKRIHSNRSFFFLMFGGLCADRFACVFHVLAVCVQICLHLRVCVFISAGCFSLLALYSGGGEEDTSFLLLQKIANACREASEQRCRSLREAPVGCPTYTWYHYVPKYNERFDSILIYKRYLFRDREWYMFSMRTMAQHCQMTKLLYYCLLMFYSATKYYQYVFMFTPTVWCPQFF